MKGIVKRKLVAGAAVLAVAAFAGGAYAASTTSGANERDAFLNDVAGRLHVSPAQLKSALQGAFADRLQAAVKAGKLTQAQADAIKQHIQQNGIPPFGFGALGLPGGAPKPFFRAHVGPGGGRLSAAASYLGISESQLLDQLQAGKSLRQIADARGKSVAGLKDAMTNAIKAKLDKAVAAKVLTSAQEQQILKTLSQRLDDEINGKPPVPYGPWRHMGMRGFAHPGMGGGFVRPGMRLYPSAPVPPSAAPVPGTVY